MAWKLLGILGILLLEISYLREAVGKLIIGTPFTHSQNLHYCLVHSVYFHNQTDLVIITELNLKTLTITVEPATQCEPHPGTAPHSPNHTVMNVYAH